MPTRMRNSLGREESDERSGLALGEVQSGSQPFSTRARRSALASVMQITMVSFLLGSLVAVSGRRTWPTLISWAALGTVGGVLMGYHEATQGLVEIGDPRWYEVLPRGGARVGDVVGLWAFLPAAVGLCAAALGTVRPIHRNRSSAEALAKADNELAIGA